MIGMLLALLACAEEEGVVTAKGTALDVVEFAVTCDTPSATVEVPGLFDRGLPVTLRAYAETSDPDIIQGIYIWDYHAPGVRCGTNLGTVRVIATYPAE